MVHRKVTVVPGLVLNMAAQISQIPLSRGLWKTFLGKVAGGRIQVSGYCAETVMVNLPLVPPLSHSLLPEETHDLRFH